MLDWVHLIKPGLHLAFHQGPSYVRTLSDLTLVEDHAPGDCQLWNARLRN
jgi:hypothetical protein